MSENTTKSDDPPEGFSEDSPDKKLLEKRWGKEVFANGYLVIPSILLRAQARLHIDCVELAVLLHLLDHWWSDDKMPFPSKRRLGERLGRSAKTIQRAMVRLEEEGLIRRKARKNSAGGQTSNLYDLTPLVEKLQPIAKEMLEAKADAKQTIRSSERPGHKLRKAAN
ncbi:helix-turn-helix domain-containing protein [Ponticaulis profundi]|uniref:Helix-turn-helix domain-containing protein n=1 Tax=Ponticaulis profundi TaxID=2665222 RepID=A0ABW1SCZ6_9PROT